MAIPIGQHRHPVTLSTPTAPVPDGDGGYTQTYTPLDPSPWWCAITPAPRTARTAETTGSDTVTAHATHVITGRSHPGITSQTRLVWTDQAGRVHTAEALDVQDPTGTGAETVVLASEVTP
jgi:head-tail adaptor